MSAISQILAREILDSRGNPTVEVDVVLESGAVGRAAVPSGASTGTYEAVELRDCNPKRFQGKGVLKAVNIINETIFEALAGEEASHQLEIDAILIGLDESTNKENIGANATLGVSLAVAQAAANDLKIPLYRYMGGCFSRILPVPLMNVINGGQHANNRLDFQEFMIVPIGASNMNDALRMGAEIFHTLKELLSENGASTAVGDEGGFAPDFKTADEVLTFLMKASEKAGYRPGEDVGFALDCAANELLKNGQYVLSGEELTLDSAGMTDFLGKLSARYPIISIEDPLGEDDWQGFVQLTSMLGDKLQIIGDDLFVTNVERLSEGISLGAANAILIKPNQIGTLSETLTTIEYAVRNGYNAVLSHRSGETEDVFIADLALATNCGQIKTGGLSRSERVAKYNQLLRLSEDLGDMGCYAGIFDF